MWIALGILLFIAAIITVILMLNVFIVIKSDENGELYLVYRFVGKTFGEEPDPNNPIVIALKKTTGVSQINTASLKKSVKESGFVGTVSSTYHILISLLKELKEVLKFCTAKKLYVDIICTGEDAAQAAINYGKCSSVTYPFLGMIHSIIKVKRGCEKINISCDYNSQNPSFKYDMLISVRLCHLLAALIRVAYKEARRNLENEESLSTEEHKNSI